MMCSGSWLMGLRTLHSLWVGRRRKEGSLGMPRVVYVQAGWQAGRMHIIPQSPQRIRYICTLSCPHLIHTFLTRTTKWRSGRLLGTHPRLHACSGRHCRVGMRDMLAMCRLSGVLRQ